MGSSGNSDYPIDTNPITISERIRQSEKKTTDKSYNTEITGIINNQLVDYNNRDTEGIKQHIKEIVKALESDIEGSLDTRYGGSVSKNTYINGLSDIDSLLLVNKSELKNKNPKQVLDYMVNRLKQRFPNSEIWKGQLAVTLRFSDKHEIQLLPAIHTATGFKIPSATDNSKWSNIIQPKKFMLALEAVNRKNLRKVVPTIKLAKAIISKLPEKRQMSGYHIEALATNIFAKYAGNKNIKEMVQYFFKKASDQVLRPIKDKTGQSTNVDNYLKGSKSLERLMISDSLLQIHRKMSNADGIKSSKFWEDLLK